MVEEVIHLDTAAMAIAREWYLRGKEEEDPLFRFVSFWVAFNCLYNYGRTDEDHGDKSRMKEYCDKHMGVLVDAIDLESGELQELKKTVVMIGVNSIDAIDWHDEAYLKEKLRDAVAGSRNPVSEDRLEQIANDYILICNPRRPKGKRIRALFETMYRIRCNLFHGSKRADPGRDARLVKEATSVLELCLPLLYEDTF